MTRQDFAALVATAGVAELAPCPAAPLEPLPGRPTTGAELRIATGAAALATFSAGLLWLGHRINSFGGTS